MMWVSVLCLLVITAVLLLHAIWLRDQLDGQRRVAAREYSLRVATEVAFCAVVEEQLGDRLRANLQRVSETARHFGKTWGDGRGPN